MALNKLKYNSLNLTPAANKAIGFDSDADALEATLSGGSMTFIKKLTASSSGTLSFVDGSSDVVLDSTYKEYIFMFKDIHGSAESELTFNMSVDSGSNYNVTKTSTFFLGEHAENGSFSSVAYQSGSDLAQGTGFKTLQRSTDFADADQSAAGILHLFNPSSTTFVKHFISRIQSYGVARSHDSFAAGYGNTTSAVDAVQFKMSSGNIDSGTITLYGIN